MKRVIATLLLTGVAMMAAETGTAPTATSTKSPVTKTARKHRHSKKTAQPVAPDAKK